MTAVGAAGERGEAIGVLDKRHIIAREGFNRQWILALIEQRDPVVVPTAPIRHGGFVAWIDSARMVCANLHYVLSRSHRHDRIID